MSTTTDLTETRDISSHQVTMPITVKGETHDVTFTGHFGSGSIHSSRAIFAGVIGMGAKLNRVSMQAVPRATVLELRKLGYSPRDILEHDGIFYGIKAGVVRNRNNVTIVGWAETLKDSAAATAHDYYGTL